MASTVSAPADRQERLIARTAVLVAFLWVVLLTAWLCDDAFITLRTVDNFVSGYGLVWNTDERVQAYTHPLWMFALSAFYFFTREPYFTTLLVSIGASCITVALLTRLAHKALWLLLPLGVALTGSKAFVDYSTSGLENPLTHLLLTVYALSYLAARGGSVRAARLLGLLAGLNVLNRFDLVLLVAPPLVERILRARSNRQRLELAALAFGPVVLWLGFATLYYGFPLPNTYYAKQAAGVARAAYLERGVAYFLEMLIHDPLTLVVILLGALLPLVNRSVRGLWSLSVGMLAYSAYIVWVGGDFMQGRFFSGLFVWALVLFLLAARGHLHARPVALAGSAAALALGLLADPFPNWLSQYPYAGLSFSRITPLHPFYHLEYPAVAHLNNVVDERSAYYGATGLLPLILDEGRVHIIEKYGLVRDALQLRQQGGRMSVEYMVGFKGFFSGPSVKIIDRFALADAFLARLPFVPAAPDWRIGHLLRHIPDGYVTTRLHNRNALTSEPLRQLYDDLHVLNTYPLLDGERLATILRLNLNPPRLSLSDLGGPASDWMLIFGQTELLTLPASGLTFFTAPPSERLPSGVLLLASAGSDYVLEIGRDTDSAAAAHGYRLPARLDLEADSLVPHVINTGAQPGEMFSVLRITPISATMPLTAGQLRLLYFEPTRETEALLEHNIALSATIGLGDLARPRTPFASDVFAGAWHVGGVRDLTLDLALDIGCEDPQGANDVRVYVNGHIVASHAFDRCDETWQAGIVLPARILKRGWNALEIRFRREEATALFVRGIAFRSD